MIGMMFLLALQGLGLLSCAATLIALHRHTQS